jgi:hypothetical protein
MADLGDVPTPGSTLDDSAPDSSPTENHAAAEGAEASEDVGSTSTLREMLLSTEPNRPLGKVESPWNPDLGAETRLYRGLMKMTNVDGMPAIVDIFIGAAEIVTSLDFDNIGGDQEDDEDDAVPFGDAEVA